MRQLIRTTLLWRQREEEERRRTVSRSAVRMTSDVSLLFKPAGSLETRGWCLLLGRIRRHAWEEKEVFLAQTTGVGPSQRTAGS